MEVLDRADIESTRGLSSDEDLGIAIDLARRDELLLVSALQAARTGIGAPTPHVELADQGSRPLDHPAWEEPAEARGRRLRVVVQRAVLGARELEYQPAPLPIFAN